MEPALGATQNAGSKKKKALDKSESFGARDTERERRGSNPLWVLEYYSHSRLDMNVAVTLPLR